MSTAGDFAGKVALVTGGGGGIGGACAAMLVSRGARVVVADANVEAAERTAASLRETGADAAAAAVRVEDPASVEAMVTYTTGLWGGLDVAMNIAGIGSRGLPGESWVDTWRRVIDVDLNGVYYCLHYEIEAMLERGGGAIVNMASAAGVIGEGSFGAEGYHPYASAKHGVVGLTKSLAIQYAGRGIRINSVGPGAIDSTGMSAGMDEETKKRRAAVHAMQRLGRVEEVAALFCFLASDAASFITGSLHMVDGGWTAR